MRDVCTRLWGNLTTSVLYFELTRINRVVVSKFTHDDVVNGENNTKLIHFAVGRGPGGPIFDGACKPASAASCGLTASLSHVSHFLPSVQGRSSWSHSGHEESYVTASPSSHDSITVGQPAFGSSIPISCSTPSLNASTEQGDLVTVFLLYECWVRM